jgi:hypothetical protein
VSRDISSTSSAAPKKKTLTLSAEAIDELQRYRWPGNVRELQNCRARRSWSTAIRPRHLSPVPRRCRPGGRWIRGAGGPVGIDRCHPPRDHQRNAGRSRRR